MPCHELRSGEVLPPPPTTTIDFFVFVDDIFFVLVEDPVNPCKLETRGLEVSLIEVRYFISRAQPSSVMVYGERQRDGLIISKIVRLDHHCEEVFTARALCRSGRR